MNWNPVRGIKGRWHCTHVSEGCRNCYAERLNVRWGGPPYKLGADTFRLDQKVLEQPLHWRKPRKVFVCDMTDLFHAGIRDEWIQAIWGVMAAAGQHTYQILTKRPCRMQEFMLNATTDVCVAELLQHSPNLVSERGRRQRDERHGYNGPWPLSNVWLGVSVEDQQTADERIPLLLLTPAAVRFVSYEPALGPIIFRREWLDGRSDDMNVITWIPRQHLHWIIVGGESGPKARYCSIEWIRSTITQCRAAQVACFVKQLGRCPAAAVSLIPTYNYRIKQKGKRRLAEVLDKTGERQCGATFITDDFDSNKIKHPKGGEPSEWPEDLRIREFPCAVNAVSSL